MTDGVQVQDIAGIILWTGDAPRLAAFYRDALRLPVHSDHGDFVAFELRPGVRLSVGKHRNVTGQAKDPFRVMVNLRVADIHAAHRALTGGGVPFLRPPERERWGGWVATLQDPDGNVIQLFQFPDAAR
jgi:predicted enzyme related to lactoylglutathione lyase